MAAVVTFAVKGVHSHEKSYDSKPIKEALQHVSELSLNSGSPQYLSPPNKELQIPEACLVAASAVDGSATVGIQAQATVRQQTNSNGSSPSEWVLCSEYSIPCALYAEKSAHLNCIAFPGLTQSLNSPTSTDSGGGPEIGFSAALAHSKPQSNSAQSSLLFSGTGETKRLNDNAVADKLSKVQWSSADAHAVCPPTTATPTFASDLKSNVDAVPERLPTVFHADAMEGQQRQRKEQSQPQQQLQPQQTHQQQQGGSAFSRSPQGGTAYQETFSRREAKTGDGGFFGRRVPSRRCQWLRALPVVFLMVLVAYILAVFITYHILPELQLNLPDFLKHTKRYNRGLVELVATGITTFFFLLAYWLSVITPAGSIPNTQEWQVTAATSSPADKGAAALETKKTGERRHCKWCRMLKPDRAHHCRVCRSCVLKMDHHCPWIYNCVGYKNHKYFLLSLIYGSLASLIIACCMYPSVRKASDSEQDFEKMFMLLFAETLDIFLCVLITGFLIFHLQYVVSADTFLKEYRDVSTHLELYPSVKKSFVTQGEVEGELDMHSLT